MDRPRTPLEASLTASGTVNWADHRECHVGADFLLIYRIDSELIRFVRAGTHANLFKK